MPGLAAALSDNFEMDDGVVHMKPGACVRNYHTGQWGMDHFIEIYAQAVPPHIGHPSDYPDGDPYKHFLPPLAQVHLDNPNEPWGPPYRAVFICAPWTVKGTTRRTGQKYLNPLVMLTGEAYEAITWNDLWGRIEAALLEPKHRKHWEFKEKGNGIRRLALV